MFRLFDMLGRSAAMRALDDELRASGVHPILVPEPVKLTVIKLNKTHAGATNQDVAFAEAAQLLAYCMLGHEQFAASNSVEDADRIDDRVGGLANVVCRRALSRDDFLMIWHLQPTR